MVPHGNRVIVCGGMSSTGYQGQDILSTECHDIQIDAWTELSECTLDSVNYCCSVLAARTAGCDGARTA